MKLPHLSIRFILLGIIGGLNILVALLVGSGLYESWRSLENAMAFKKASAATNLVYDAGKHLSMTRAASLAITHAPPEISESLHEILQKNRAAYDLKIKAALSAMPQGSFRNRINAIHKEHTELQKLRAKLDLEMKKPPEQRSSGLPQRIYDASSLFIESLRALMRAYTAALDLNDAVMARHMIYKNAVWELTEHAGKEYALIGKLIAEKKYPSAEEQEMLRLLRDRILYNWQSLEDIPLDGTLAEKLLPYREEAESHYFGIYASLKEFFYDPAPQVSAQAYPLDVELWLELSSQAVDSLLGLQDAVLLETLAHAEHIEKYAKREILFSLFIFLFTISLSLFGWRIIVLRVTRPVNAMIETLYKAATGEAYETPRVIYRQDEIGKLASVLAAYQENARRIQQSNEELERYAYITAHDLKSPLRAIDNLSQWLEEDLGPALNGQNRAHMDLLRQRVRRMEKLLSDILDYSRLEKEIETAERKIVNGRDLVEDALSLVPVPSGFTVKIGREFSSLRLPHMPLHQLFFNLINNAVRHHDKDAGLIEVGVTEYSDHYIFTVSDDGPGIHPQYHARIFEMFQTLQPRDKREGSGMGLAIVRKIVNAAGGSILLDSAPGAGAKFSIHWPKN